MFRISKKTTNLKLRFPCYAINVYIAPVHRSRLVQLLNVWLPERRIINSKIGAILWALENRKRKHLDFDTKLGYYSRRACFIIKTSNRRRHGDKDDEDYDERRRTPVAIPETGLLINAFIVFLFFFQFSLTFSTHGKKLSFAVYCFCRTASSFTKDKLFCDDAVIQNLLSQ